MDYTNFDESQSLAMLLDRARRSLGTGLQRLFTAGGFDITVEQWMILLLLWKTDGLTQTHIAEVIGKDKGTISPQIDGLQRRDLIRRTPDRDDRRRNVVSLTAKGRRLEQELIPLGFTNMAIARQGITAKDLATCKEVLRRVCTNLEAGAVPADPRHGKQPKTLTEVTKT